jgi:GNAT superfamily N-acetyltransferase
VTEQSYLPFIGGESAWVAERGGRVVGFAGIDLSSANVWALFVAPDAEGSGVGRALHEQMLGWGRSKGLPRLSLQTSSGTRAERFYTAAGWKYAGTTTDGELRFEFALSK